MVRIRFGPCPGASIWMCSWRQVMRVTELSLFNLWKLNPFISGIGGEATHCYDTFGSVRLSSFMETSHLGTEVFMPPHATAAFFLNCFMISFPESCHDDIYICMFLQVKRTLGQFTPARWDKDEWHPLLGPWRFVQVLFLCIVFLTVELNTFFLKFCLWIPPRNPVIVYRLILWWLIAIPTIREYNSYLQDRYASLFFSFWPSSKSWDYSILLFEFVCHMMKR